MNTIAPPSFTPNPVISTIVNICSSCCSSLNMIFRNCIYGNDPTEEIARETTSLLKSAQEQSYQMISRKPITWANKGGRFLTREQRLEKMHTNLLKSIHEHRRNSQNPDVYINEKQAIFYTIPTFSMEFSSEIFSEKTLFRDEMEDAHFLVQISQGYLAGIFDGHGGSEISQYAAKVFPLYFEKALTGTKNAHHALERVFNEIQMELYHQGKIDETGTTAVVCFLDRKYNLFTATLGDSEANIYRFYDEKLKCIPLSPVRNFFSSSEVNRVNQIYGTYLQTKKLKPSDYFKDKDPNQSRYFPTDLMKDLKVHINVSRSLGDMKTSLIFSESYQTLTSEPRAEQPINFFSLVKDMVIIHKPKITMHRLLPNDILILGCDGLFDYLQEKDRLTIIAKHRDIKTVITEIAQASIRGMEMNSHGDNLTIIGVKASLDDRHLY